jgi:hypothetical protein
MQYHGLADLPFDRLIHGLPVLKTRVQFYLAAGGRL